jgi:hypothetical protein
LYSLNIFVSTDVSMFIYDLNEITSSSILMIHIINLRHNAWRYTPVDLFQIPDKNYYDNNCVIVATRF